MKNFLLASGLVLLLGTIIPITNASREVYHQYLIQKAHEDRSVRHFAEPNWSAHQSFDSSSRKKISAANIRRSYVNFRASRNNISTPNASQSDRPIRTFSMAKRKYGNSTPRVNVVRKTPFVVSQRINDDLVFRSHKTEDFLVEVPADFGETEKTNTVGNQEASIRVESFESCSKYGFNGCALTTSLAKNKELGYDLKSTAVRQYGERGDVFLDNYEAKKPYMTESFLADINREIKFVARHFIQSDSGEIYVIEMITDKKLAPKYLKAAQYAFDTFRVYGDGLMENGILQ